MAGMKRSRGKPPRKVAQKDDSRTRLTVQIEALNEQGAGIARQGRHQFRVEKTLPGEEVLIEYAPERPRKSRIRLLQILRPAPERRIPPCSYFTHCGGCQLQHLDYEAQLAFKAQLLRDLLAAHPGLNGITVHPPEGMPEPLYYRNKTQLPFQERAGKAVFGLFQSGTHELSVIEQCQVETRDANRVLQVVRDWANQHHIPIYNEQTHQGFLRHVVVRRSIFTHQLMVVLVVTSREIPKWQILLGELKNHFSNLHSVQLNINRERTNLILGEENIGVWGEPYIEEQLGAQKFRVYPNTFFQINPVQMGKLLERLKQIAGFRRQDRVLDLYCGVGAISLAVAPLVQSVTGIDTVAASITAAQQNMTDNNITNARFICEDAGAGFRRLQEEGRPADVIITDPPRKGLSEALIKMICAARPRKVVYVSCNPATLVRDLALFQKQGYQAGEIFPFDMFPQTYHVESLVVLEPGPPGQSRV